MPTSGDGVLTATFDAAWAAVRLVVDGAEWASTVDAVTIVRSVPGQVDVAVRGVSDRPAVGGFFVGADTEMDLGSVATYTVTGSFEGSVVASASVAVETTGAAAGLWVKVPGIPDLTCRARFRAMSAVDSPTIGGVYQIAAGGSPVVQSTAQWSGVETDRATVELGVDAGTGVDRLRAALAAGRVLLLQPVGSSDLDPGWYYVANVARSNPAGMEAYPHRWFSLDVQRVSMPAGDGSGIPGMTWATVIDTYETWQDVIDAKATWFDLLQGV